MRETPLTAIPDWDGAPLVDRFLALSRLVRQGGLPSPTGPVPEDVRQLSERLKSAREGLPAGAGRCSAGQLPEALGPELAMWRRIALLVRDLEVRS